MLIHFFETLYRPLRLRGKSVSTIRLYHHTIRAFGKFLGREALLTDFTDLSVSAYLSHMADRKLSPYTIAKERSQLLALWTFAAKKKLVDTFPDVPQEKLPELAPSAWMKEQLETLLAACHAEEGKLCGVPAGPWWHALHLVIWDTGERIGAIRAMEWSWLDGPWLTVPARVRKGKTRDRLYLLAPDTSEALSRIRQPERKGVFPWPYNANYIYRRYERILERAGLPTDRRSKFHRMRRSVASHFAAAGGDATALLDHTKRETTKAYLDMRIVGEQRPVDLLFRIEAQRKRFPRRHATRTLEA